MSRGALGKNNWALFLMLLAGIMPVSYTHLVQMGTRFVVAKESIVHENYKERIVKARDIDSEVTGMSTGHPIRVLRNAMSREYLKLEKEGAGFEELEQLTLGSLRKAVMDGDVVHGSLMAGQCAGLVKKEQTCQELSLIHI